MNIHGKSRGKKLFGCAAAIALASAIGMTAFAPRPTENAKALSYNAEAAKSGWTTDFETYEEEQEYAARFNKQIVEEGAVLLKNKDGALPLTASERDITLFGTNSYKPFYGGTGSAGMTGDVKTTDLVSSLEKSGFRLNQKVQNIYNNV